MPGLSESGRVAGKCGKPSMRTTADILDRAAPSSEVETVRGFDTGRPAAVATVKQACAASREVKLDSHSEWFDPRAPPNDFIMATKTDALFAQSGHVTRAEIREERTP